MNDPDLADSRQNGCDDSSARRMVSSAFRPAAAYLLWGPPTLPRDRKLVRTDDSDVGPILTHPDDTVIGHSIRETKTWEPGEGRFLRSVLRSGMNVIDVGANIGYFTLLMARSVSPDGRVLAVEAEPWVLQILRANIELNRLSRVEVLPVAAHRVPGLLTMKRNPDNQGASTGVTMGGSWQTTPAQAVRLDDVLDPHMPIDVIKIDIEGMDHAAVDGLRRTILRWQPTVLVELNPWKTEAFGSSPADVLRQYREIGLEIRLLGGDALRLHYETGMRLDDLLLDNLVVTPQTESEIIERARSVDFINLILTPMTDSAARRRSQV